MNLKTTLFSAFCIFSAVLLIGLPSCTSPTSNSQTNNSTSSLATISECDCSKLVPNPAYPYPLVDPKIAKCRLDAYNQYAESFKRISDTLAYKNNLNYNLVNYNAGTFSIPIGNLKQIEPIVGNGKVWAMMALDTVTYSGAIHQTIKVYLATEDKKGAAVYYHITSREKVDRIPNATAINNINAFAKLVGQLDNAGAQSNNHKISYPKGFLYPRQDVEDIYTYRKKGSYLYGVLTIAPAKQPVSEPDSVHMYVYAFVDSTNAQTLYSKLFNGRTNANYNGGDTYFDFVNPCPNFCPQGL